MAHYRSLFQIAAYSAINENVDTKKTIQELNSYANIKFESDFNTYIERLNFTDITISGSYVFDKSTYDKKDNRLNIICYVTYNSEDILNYYTEDYDSPIAKKLCESLKSIYQVVKDNKFINYTCQNVGSISITIVGDYKFNGITVSGEDNNKYTYDYSVDYDCVLINDDYVYMKSDGSFTSTTSLSGTEVTDDEELGTCWSLAMDVVKSQLKSPSSAKFPFSYADEDVSITKLEDIYTVKAWVDAENSFGSTLRSNFTVTMKKSALILFRKHVLLMIISIIDKNG